MYMYMYVGVIAIWNYMYTYTVEIKWMDTVHEKYMLIHVQADYHNVMGVIVVLHS